ncbi:MAG: hypothetical protein KGQ87_05850, partial [Verrucomicrobia bacterium]|nr:hypothetical protein [Verrucomicrobiota bacterium]
MKTCLSLTSLAAFSLLWLSSAQNTTAAGLTPAPTSANNTAGSLKSQAQVETASAVGTISSTGNAKVTLTSANIDAGTPLVFLVAVTSGDTSSVWAGKVRSALSADLQVAELFVVGGTGSAITLTRKPQLVGEGVSYYEANDSTLNLALDNDTATGITTATSSEDTTAGFLASTAQVETATADGIITTAGNARVIVTAAGLPGSPKAYSVTVLANDVPVTTFTTATPPAVEKLGWADKVRAVLKADPNLTALYDVGGDSTASITLTRKKVSIVSGKDIFAVNDPTLNINIDNNTCAGIIPQSISSNTTAGTLQNAGQVETATALGAVTTPGNMQVVVTSDTLLEKPNTTPLEIGGKWTAEKLIEVPVLAGDSTSAWATKVRTALNADADVSSLFTASGTGSKIVLSRKADNVSPGLSIFADNDPTLNLALVTGSKGILPKLTSTNTTAGELDSKAQVEIATAAGTINTNGTLEVVVTAAGLPGSPKSINVPVLAGDIATAWAAKVRAALNADSDITNLFAVGGASDSITLTSKLLVRLDGVDIYPVNDPTLNIALIIDTDGDKLADFDEIYVHLTDPKKADTDDDGFSDFTEVQATPPSDPKDPNSKPPFTPPTYYDKSQYVDQVDVKISQPYTPFGNRLEFNRYGDDGSKCVLDANGVLTWVGNKGEVRLLPDSSKAIPLFVTNTECLVWVNRFVDYNTYPDRPDAQLRLYRSTPESNEVTSQEVSFQGKEIIATPQVTTTTGALTFVSATRKDNGDETPVIGGTINNSDDCELRFYRLTFDAGVQFVGAKTLPIRAVDDFEINTVGPDASSIGYGSDGSLAIQIPQVQTNPKLTPAEYELKQTYWIDSQGRFLRVQADDNTAPGYQPQGGSAITGTTTTPGVDIDRALFVSNTRLLFEHSGSSQGTQEHRRSSSTGNLLPSSIKDLTASVKGTVLDIWNYSQVGVNRYFYTVNTSDEVTTDVPDDTGTIIRTYRVTSNGISEVAKTTLTGGLTISSATMTGTVNTNDGSALLATEDGDALIWLHSAGYTALPNSSQASALFVANDQAVIWENAKAPVGGNGQIPNAIVKHYKQVGTVATTIRTDGNKTLLNTSRLTPDPEYWFFTTAIKTDASTSRLTTYKLGTIEIANVDTDKDGLLDYYETNTGTFVSATDTGTDPNKADSDIDGLNDGSEVTNYKTNPTDDDSDNDTLKDGAEVLTYFTNPLLADTDGDSLSDSVELNTHNTDPLKKDTDGDALEDDDEISLGTDPRDTDTDNDNLTDGDEVTRGTNPKLKDTDGDTLDDDKEVLVHLTDPNDPDTDGDLLPDAEEVSKGTDPNNDKDPKFIDTDKDNLTNFDEIYVHNTDPKKADTDGDGINDDVEITGGGDPLDAESDTDGDGLKDRVETRTGIFVSATNTGTDPYDIDKDTDNDGLLDNVETGTGVYVSLSNTGTNPNVPDTDGDGLSDKIEIDFKSSPFVFDTDNDLASDADEYNATPQTNPRDPSDYPSPISRPEGLHAVVRSLGEQQVSIDQTFSPFGHRPERDKVGDDGSTAIIDRNGVLIWSDKDGQTFTIPNSSLAKTLFVSNSECIVYNNRFESNSYNTENEVAEIIIHRRGPNGIVSKTININGTLLDTAPVTATTYGFTILSGKRLDDGKESRQITLEQSNNNGVITTTEKVEEKDIWDILNLTLYQITWDGLLKQLDWDSIPIPGGDVGINFHGSPQIKASGSDGSIIVEMITGDEFVDRYDDPEPGVFLSKLTCHWVTLTANQESIEELPGVFSDALYVDNDRALFERLVDGSNNAYEIVDYRQRAAGGSRVASTFPLPAGERTLPLGAYSIRGLSPYIYTLNTAGDSLKLYRADAKITPLGAAVALPVAIEPSSVMVRNPRDASLLTKTEDSGLLWVPTTTNGTSSAVTGFATPKSLPGTAQGKPLYVKADEAVAWLNSEAL